MKRLLFVFLLLVPIVGLIFADVPERKEQFVYSIVAFQGDEYAGTFCKEDSKEIYLLADNDNFLVGQNTFVYYWAITKEWRTDVRTFQHIFDGKLEVTGPGIETTELAKEEYTYYMVKGDYGDELVIATGEEAEQVREDYRLQIRDYYDAINEYNRAQTRHEKELMELASTIREKRDAGEDVSELLEKLQTMAPPGEPKRPEKYVVPPVEVRAAYIINLPPGEYTIRHFNEEGKVFESSEKRLVVFERNRTKGIGYEIIPGDKWTRPEESKTPSSVIYVDGSTDLYLRPFYENEYNDHYYKRLVDNNDSGNPNLMTWKRGVQIPQATIQLFHGKPSQKQPDEALTEKPYFVEQSKGSSLGYKIVPFDPEGAHKDREPSLKAFHVSLSETVSRMSLRVEGGEGELLKGSTRQIRVVDTEKNNFFLLIISIVPLIVMAVVIVGRQKRYSS
jgi:hypothetical protein